MRYGETMLDVEGCQLQAFMHRAHGIVGKSGLGIVIFHPYGLLGGSSDDPVVLSIFRQAMRSDAVQTVVRYNQRGVGTSRGSKSVWGASDLTDAVAVCQHVLSLQNGPKHLHLIGYSWGACLAAHAASQLKDVTAFVGISPVTGSASFLLRSKRHLAELHTRPDLPKLLILGDHDQFSSLASMQKVFQPHKQKAGMMQNTPQSQLPSTIIETMAQCDHFFASQRSELANKVLSFCDSVQLTES